MSGAWDYRLQHLARMSDEHGLFEHALHDAPRLEHGYCTDDNARLLVVASREPDEGIAHDLSRLALRFVLEAQTDAGLVHNRFGWDGTYRGQLLNPDVFVYELRMTFCDGSRLDSENSSRKGSVTLIR